MITPGVAYQFLRDQVDGLHDLDSDTLKIALFNTLASIDRTTVDAYDALTNECSGTGYTAGGAAITATVVSSAGQLAAIDFSNPSWTGLDLGSSVPAQAVAGAVIYNTTRSNKVICVISFGTPIVLSTQDFTIVFPDASNPINAYLRAVA